MKATAKARTRSLERDDPVSRREVASPPTSGQRPASVRFVVLAGGTMEGELQAFMDAIEQRATLDAWQQRRELLGTRSQNEKGDTPLTWAARVGNAEAVAWLIGRGVGIDSSTTADAATPLCIACQEGQVECVQLLLGASASVDLATTHDGTTPMFMACL